MTTTKERLERLERQLAHQAAILDGSEAQTREAAVAVLALVVDHLIGKGMIEHGELRAELVANVSEPLGDDYVGRLILDLVRALDFHKADREGEAPAHVPVSALLTREERDEVLASALSGLASETSARSGRPASKPS